MTSVLKKLVQLRITDALGQILTDDGVADKDDDCPEEAGTGRMVARITAEIL